MNAARLLEYFDRIAEAPDGVSRLRKFVLDLAVRGKLVKQDPNEVFSKFVGEVNSEEWPYEVPSSWKWFRFGSVADISGGFAFRSPDYAPEGVFILRVTNIEPTGKIDNSNAVYFPKVKINQEIKKFFLNEGDVLLVMVGGSLGKVGVVTKDVLPALLNQNLWKVAPFSNLIAREYLRLLIEFLVSFQRQITHSTHGHLSRAEFRNKLVAIPPLAEQHRIVAKVDELMALCDRLEASQAKRESRRDRLASASLKRIGQPEDVGNGEEFRENVRFHLHHLPRLTTRPEHVKELRQTILNLAVRGKLVPQDPNDEPASELLNKTQVIKDQLIRGGFFNNTKLKPQDSNLELFPVPMGWKWCRLGELSGLITKGSSPKWQGVNYVGKESGVLFITSENVGNYSLRKLDDPKYVESRFNEMEIRSILMTGDILINLVGASIGRVALYDLDEVANINQAVALVRLVPHDCMARVSYLLHYLNSRFSIDYMLKSQVVTAQPNISLTDVREFPVPLPPLAEQHRIVAKVDELMNLCDKLEVHLATNQTNQSRLLEATLCDALGVTCLPASRPSRPAPSLKRVAATHSEQPPKPITPRPGPVETPTAAVQGSLIEQPTPQVGKPRAANGDVPEAILAQMQPGQEYSRAQLADALGLSVYEWNMAIRELKESGRVVQAGERRGARYRIN